MKKKLLSYTLWGILFVLVLGTLSHFIYGWTNENPVAGLFVPVSESTWEHMKLLFFPMLLWTFFMLFKLQNEYTGLISGFCAGILIGTAAIPVLFYTYSGILGQNYFVMDLLVFLISTLLAFYYGYHFTVSQRLADYRRFFELLIFLLLLCFFIFTYYPPSVGLFQNPL